MEDANGKEAPNTTVVCQINGHPTITISLGTSAIPTTKKNPTPKHPLMEESNETMKPNEDKNTSRTTPPHSKNKEGKAIEEPTLTASCL